MATSGAESAVYDCLAVDMSLKLWPTALVGKVMRLVVSVCPSVSTRFLNEVTVTLIFCASVARTMAIARRGLKIKVIGQVKG